MLIELIVCFVDHHCLNFVFIIVHIYTTLFNTDLLNNHRTLYWHKSLFLESNLVMNQMKLESRRHKPE